MSEYEHTCMIRGDGGRTIRAILDHICNKWTLLIVATLDQEACASPTCTSRSSGSPSAC